MTLHHMLHLISQSETSLYILTLSWLRYVNTDLDIVLWYHILPQHHSTEAPSRLPPHPSITPHTHTTWLYSLTHSPHFPSQRLAHWLNTVEGVSARDSPSAGWLTLRPTSLLTKDYTQNENGNGWSFGWRDGSDIWEESLQIFFSWVSLILFIILVFSLFPNVWIIHLLQVDNNSNIY